MIGRYKNDLANLRNLNQESLTEAVLRLEKDRAGIQVFFLWVVNCEFYDILSFVLYCFYIDFYFLVVSFMTQYVLFL